MEDCHPGFETKAMQTLGSNQRSCEKRCIIIDVTRKVVDLEKDIRSLMGRVAFRPHKTLFSSRPC